MEKHELEFLEENKINFESVKLGFIRNINFKILEGYEQLYRKYLDPQFVLTYWCGDCVFEMLNRLIYYVETHTDFFVPEVEKIVPNTVEQETIEQQIVEPKKRGRKKKDSKNV